MTYKELIESKIIEKLINSEELITYNKVVNEIVHNIINNVFESINEYSSSRINYSNTFYQF
jgi:uncharacterized phage-associated protein